MSIAGNPALIIEALVDTTRLPSGMAQAEAIVDSATERIGSTVDDAMGRVADSITSKIRNALLVGFAVQSIDRALRAGIDSIKAGGSFAEAGAMAGEEIAKGLRSLPIVGAIGGAIADLFLAGMLQIKDQVPNFVKVLATPLIEGFGFFESIEAMEMEAKQAQSRIDAQANFLAEQRKRQVALQGELGQLQRERGGFAGDPFREMVDKLAQSQVQTADTALGSFRFGIGGGADISRRIFDNAQEQVRILKRIEEIQGELRDVMKVTN